MPAPQPMPPRHRRRLALTLSLTALLVLTALAPVSAAAAGKGGKPGYPDRITWSGETWQVKTSRSLVGPGPNLFEAANVSVDAQGRLHLRIARNGSGAWSSAEIIGPRTYGYGTYTFTLASRVDALDPNVVLGLFTWSDRARFAHREIDIEFARWGSATDPTNAQYVVQPWDGPGHTARFTQPAAERSVHRFTWRPGRIDWQSLDGNGNPTASYTYTDTDVPPSGDERVRLNLWLFQGAAPTNGQPVEVVIESFSFTP